MATVADRLLEILTPEQRYAATSLDRTTIVQAGPGTGKTSVLSARIAWLVIARRVRPSAILAFTFTRAAAAELRARLIESLGIDQAEQIEVATFHAWALRLLRLNPEAAGLPPEFSIANEYEEDAAIERIFKGGEARPEAKRVGVEKFRAALCSFDAGDGIEKGDVGTLIRVLESRLLAFGRVTISSVPRLLMTAIHYERLAVEGDAPTSLDVGPIHAALGSYREVLVDEAHDATPVEIELASKCHRVEHFLFALDPKQAIYGWRGADGLTAIREAGAAGAALPLTRCFRFGKRIAEVSNEIVDEMRRRSPMFDLFSVAPAKGVESLVKWAREDSLPTLVPKLAETYGPEEVAVLCRTNATAESIASRIGVLAETVRPRETPAWLAAAMDVARLVLNPADDSAFFRLWKREESRCLWRGPISRYMADVGFGARLFSHYRAKLHDDSSERGTLLDLAATIPFDTRFGDILPICSAVLRDWPSDRDPAAGAYEALPLREALDAIAVRDEVSGFDEIARGGKVSVSTVHAAKGREWDAVVVVTDDRWPAPALADPSDAKIEDLRVYYVALTRARRELVISRPAEGGLR